MDGLEIIEEEIMAKLNIYTEAVYRAFGLEPPAEVGPSKLERLLEKAKNVGGAATKLVLLPIAAYFIADGAANYVKQATTGAPSGYALAQESETQKNIEALQAAGWEVYATKEEIKSLPKFKYFFNRNEIDIKIVSEETLSGYIKTASNILMPIMDRNLQNDELRYIFIAENGYIGLRIESSDKAIGKNGTYFVCKNIGQDQALTILHSLD